MCSSIPSDVNDDEGAVHSNLTSRCSPKAIHAVISRFSEFKKNMVRETGFAGLLHMPCITKVNLKLSKWLLSCLDSERKMLVLRLLHEIVVHENDVGTVFGIPSREYDVLGPEAHISKDGIEFLRSVLGLSGTSYKGLEAILEEELDESSSQQQVDRFKVAFVVFAMSHLLTPSTKHGYGNTEF